MGFAIRVIMLITVVVCISLLIQLIKQSPIDPVPLSLFPLKAEGPYAPNTILQSVEKLGEGLLGPEDVAVDARGTLYTATARDGWVKRMWSNGSWANWMYVGGYPLGLRVGLHGEILVAEPTMGLLNVTDGRVSVLSTEADGIKYKLADELVVASNGMIYFTDASTKFGLNVWFMDVLEARPHGRLLKYNPATGTTSVVLNGLAFANGVELSKEEDFLIVCETWKFTCLKYWLEGDKKGTTEVFIDNLPGGPDNIHKCADGTFWIALLGLRSPIMDVIYKSPFLKYLAAAYPSILDRINPIHKEASVLKVTADGKPIVRYQDPTGKQMTKVTSALQDGDHLYIGSLGTNFIGRIHLKSALSPSDNFYFYFGSLVTPYLKLEACSRNAPKLVKVESPLTDKSPMCSLPYVLSTLARMYFQSLDTIFLHCPTLTKIGGFSVTF